MRRNQVSLTITRYNSEVPKGYPQDRMVINIYTDSNNLYAALSEGYAKAINVIEEWEQVAVRCDITTNADESIAAKVLNRRYSENYDLDYCDDRLEMDRQLLGYIENSTAILDVIKRSTKENVRANLEKELGYSQREIQNILRINFGMMTSEDVKEIKNDILKLEKIIEEREKRKHQ